MGYWETLLSRDEAGRRALTSYAYMCTDRATVIVVSPWHCIIDLGDTSAGKTHVLVNNKRLEAILCVDFHDFAVRGLFKCTS